MLVIPLGPENRELRSFPSVSVTIACSLIAAFVALGPHAWEDTWGPKVESRAHRVESLLLEKPYLVSSPKIDALLGAGARAEIQRRRDEARGKASGAPAFLIEGQQAELDIAQRELLAALEEAPTWRWGFIPATPSLARAFTSTFLHGDWLHLVGNLLFFFAVAPFLEDVYGHLLFLALYVSSGVVASYAHAALTSDPQVPAIGASGAIAGLMGAFLFRLGTTRIRFLFFPVLVLPFIRFSFRVSAAIVLPLWFASQVLLADADGPETGVALWAHIGGFLYGLVIALAFRLAKVEPRGTAPPATRTPSRTANAPSDDPRALDLAFRAALDGGNDERAFLLADRLLAALARRRQVGPARDLIAEVRGRLGGHLSPHFLLSAARFLEEDGDIQECLPLYQELASRFPTDLLTLSALARIVAILESRGDVEGVRQTCDRASRHPLFSPSWKPHFRTAAGPTSYRER